tara:strand:- start:2141 stop:2284 length:144 start_codon:yes stop_codon:yes gene_type:complete
VEYVPEHLGVGFTDQLEIVAKHDLISVARLKRNLGCIARVAQPITSK